MTRNEKINQIVSDMTTWNSEVILGFAEEAMRDQLNQRTNPQITEIWKDLKNLVPNDKT